MFENRQIDIQQCIRLTVKNVHEYQAMVEQNKSSGPGHRNLRREVHEEPNGVPILWTGAAWNKESLAMGLGWFLCWPDSNASGEGSCRGQNSLNSLHAEGNALLWGLERAHSRGLRKLGVRTDSLRLVKIVNGEEACPLDLVPIWERIRDMHGKFAHCDVSFVKREMNGRAHCLAKSVLNYSVDQ